VHEENVRGGTPNAITATRELIGDRPAGMTSLRSPIVRTALQAGRALNLKELRLGEGSTDANIPISLGIPAIAIGGGGTGADAHAPTESFDSTDAWQGTQYALLVTIALAQK
jgi:acetylornithine deacetylase/succinyl-diaminopimelate desuccinylase-like protein